MFVLFLVLGLTLSFTVPTIIFKIYSSRYNRVKLEALMEECLGAANITDAITDELLIVAYDYNSQEPRFYSKYYANLDPNIYLVPIGNATGASSAAPTFFTPKLQYNNYDLKELQIDGGVIANNPALYAYHIASTLNDHKKVRVLTIGTGNMHFSNMTASLDKTALFSRKAEFMINIDAFSADWFLRNHYKFVEKEPWNYVRMQTESNIEMDDVRVSALDGLQKDGMDMWER